MNIKSRIVKDSLSLYSSDFSSGRFVRGLTSGTESNGERDLPALLAHRLLGWKVRSGTRLSRRKQWVRGLFEPFSFGAFGLVGKPPHS